MLIRTVSNLSRRESLLKNRQVNSLMDALKEERAQRLLDLEAAHLRNREIKALSDEAVHSFIYIYMHVLYALAQCLSAIKSTGYHYRHVLWIAISFSLSIYILCRHRPSWPKGHFLHKKKRHIIELKSRAYAQPCEPARNCCRYMNTSRLQNILYKCTNENITYACVCVCVWACPGRWKRLCDNTSRAWNVPMSLARCSAVHEATYIYAYIYI